MRKSTWWLGGALVLAALVGCYGSSSGPQPNANSVAQAADAPKKVPAKAGAAKEEAKSKDSAKADAPGVVIDKEITEYKPVSGISGNLKSAGSDTMANLMALWAEGFKKFYPNVVVETESKGSSSAPVALIEGTADFGPMSRPMKEAEINDFEKKFGYKPTAISSSIDMLAVYVHKDNPISEVTLEQVDAIFSKGRKLGASKDIRTWGDLGVKGSLAKSKISMYGRNAASGTYGYFKEHALGKGDFKDNVKEQPGSSAVVQGVAKDKAGIGYSGIGYKTADVKALSLAEDASSEYIAAEPENAYTGEYPLSRALLIYVNIKPDSELPPLQREFLKYVLSKQGQQDVVKDGYFPVTAKMARDALKKAGVAADETASR
ncbi:MAG: PstS family phosphate ABC transporter substrate-binding protein [Pirellulales bacterium]